MDDTYYHALLRTGVDQWNFWRMTHQDVRPDLQGVDLQEQVLDGVNFYQAHLTNANLYDADLNGANLREANLSGADLCKAHLILADLRDAHLYEADFRHAHLNGANLRQSHLRLARLNEADLRDADLSGADLNETNLSGADLSEAHLNETNLSGAYLRGVNLSRADLSQTDLSGADLSMANLSRASVMSTRFNNATLDGCNIYGISVWNAHLDGARQNNLRITPLDEPEITVDNLEVAQFLYMLLHNARLRAVLDTIASKVVLILGRFSAERKPVLDALREALRNHPNGYVPVLFDFGPQQEKPVFDTVKTLANLARFVVADLTDPNMIRSELTYITANVPTAPVRPLIQRDTALPPEYATWREYRSFLTVYRYDNL